MYRVSDFCIGDFPIKEFFSANPAIYSARYNLQGYPGIRLAMPSLTPIIAAAPGFVLESGFEEAGKGKFVSLVHEGFLTVYGHLADIQVQKGEKVIAGQLIAHSNQSGMAEYPCLYFGIAPCDSAGNKTEENGYDGFIDPLNDNLVAWNIQNLKEPLTKEDAKNEITIDVGEYNALVAQATNYKVILTYLQDITLLDDFVKEKGQEPINLKANPEDSSSGQKITAYLDTVANELDALNKEIETLEKKIEPELPEPQIAVPFAKNESLLMKFLQGVKKFIFK